jgi:hypothetical protein
MSKHSTFFVGLDLGEKFSSLTIIDVEGDLIEDTHLPGQLCGRRESS